MLATLMVDYFHYYAQIGKSGGVRSPKFDENWLRIGFFKGKTVRVDFARCLILLVGMPRHFASAISLDVTYLDKFKGFKRGEFGPKKVIFGGSKSIITATKMMVTCHT